MAVRDRLRSRWQDARARAPRLARETWAGSVRATVALAGAVREARAQVRAAWGEDGRATESIADNYRSRAAVEDAGFRRISGGQAARYDLSYEARRRALELSTQLYLSNSVVKSAIDIHTSFVVGSGFTVTAKDPKVQAVIDRHWYDRAFGDWPARQTTFVRALAMFGMLVLDRRRDADGVTRLRYVSPHSVAGLARDPKNASVITGVTLGSNALAPERTTLRVVMSGDESLALSAEARAERATFGGGECFLVNVNQVEPGDWGLPDLVSGFDAADWLTTFLDGTLIRTEYQQNVVWDVSIEGLTDPALKKFEERMKDPPAPGTLNVHDAKQRWSPLAPDYKGADTAQIAGLFLDHAARAARMPPHWLSNPEDVNLATASAMGSPAIRGLIERQALFGRLIECAIDDQLAYAVSRNELPREALARGSYSVAASPIVDQGERSVASGAMVAALASALSAARMEGWVSHETAMRVFASVISTVTGVEVNAADEAATAPAATPQDVARDEGARGAERAYRRARAKSAA